MAALPGCAGMWRAACLQVRAVAGGAPLLSAADGRLRHTCAGAGGRRRRPRLASPAQARRGLAELLSVQSESRECAAHLLACALQLRQAGSLSRRMSAASPCLPERASQRCRTWPPGSLQRLCTCCAARACLQSACVQGGHAELLTLLSMSVLQIDALLLFVTRGSCATPALPAHACCTRTRLRRTQAKRCCVWCLHGAPGAKVPSSVTQLLPARGAVAVRQRGASPSVRSRRTRAGRAGPARAKLRPHTVSPRLAVPEHIMRPPYVDTGENPFYDEVQVHDAQVRSQLRRRTRSSHHCCFLLADFGSCIAGELQVCCFTLQAGACVG